MTDIKNSDRSYYVMADIFKVISRIDRLRALIALGECSYSVTDLARLIYGDISSNHLSQMSTALMPMRRLGLICSVPQGRKSYHELTELGREVLSLINSVHFHRSNNH